MNDIEQRVKKVIAEQLSINEADIWKTLSRLKSRTINKKSCVRFNKRLTTSKPTLSNFCHL